MPFLKTDVFHFLEHGHCLEQEPWREDARRCLPPATIRAMLFTNDPADAIAQGKARVACLEIELMKSRTALESLRAELSAGQLSPPTVPAFSPAAPAPCSSTGRRPLLRTNPRPTADEIRHGLSAVLCRCTGYQGIVAAVAAAAAALDRTR